MMSSSDRNEHVHPPFHTKNIIEKQHSFQPIRNQSGLSLRSQALPSCVQYHADRFIPSRHHGDIADRYELVRHCKNIQQEHSQMKKQKTKQTEHTQAQELARVLLGGEQSSAVRLDLRTFSYKQKNKNHENDSNTRWNGKQYSNAPNDSRMQSILLTTASAYSQPKHPQTFVQQRRQSKRSAEKADIHPRNKIVRIKQNTEAIPMSPLNPAEKQRSSSLQSLASTTLNSSSASVATSFNAHINTTVEMSSSSIDPNIISPTPKHKQALHSLPTFISPGMSPIMAVNQKRSLTWKQAMR